MNGGDTALDRARERLLGPAGLDEAMIGRALAVLAGAARTSPNSISRTTSLRSWQLEGGASPKEAFRRGRAWGPGLRIVDR
ncbi:hypothetical protein ACRAWD_22270 [Caulobacter segnis]